MTQFFKNCNTKKLATARTILLTVLAALVFFASGLFAGFRLTMKSLVIETDGDGDSAFVTAFGVCEFYGINGYKIG